jgi:uncharacterized protein
VLIWIAWFALIAVITGVLPLWLFQARMIYFPSRYEAGFERQLPAGVSLLRYRCAVGEQTAFYVQPHGGAEARRVWLIWGGNGMIASRWIHHFAGRTDLDATDGFVLIDYPGYGANEGSPSPRSILEASEGAADAIATQLGWSDAEREARFAVFAHSMGCAAALQFVAKHAVSQVVLVSPFTDLLSMARRTVGWPLCHLLSHRFDNRARLAEIHARRPPPRIVIIHGSRDEVIPVEMGRALAREFPDIGFDEVIDGDHNDIIDDARDRILAAMAR